MIIIIIIIIIIINQFLCFLKNSVVILRAGNPTDKER